MADKTSFIISPIGQRGSEIRNHFDKVRKHIIDPIAKEKGYTTLRSDDITLPGRITSQIIDHLKNDDLVIADLSRKNPNVYYELAIRHAVHKPVILIGENELDIPFDLQAQRVIPYSLDPDDIVTAKEHLMSQIASVESQSFEVDSPITDMIDITRKQPRTEEDSIQRILAILETQSRQINQIRADQRDKYPGFVVEAATTAKSDWESSMRESLQDQFSNLGPRGVKLLRYLSGSEKNYTPKMVSQEMNLSLTSAHAYLNRLVEFGAVHVNDMEKPYTYSITLLGYYLLGNM